MTFDLTPDFFIEMAWKSAAICALALAALALLRSRSAADRAAVVRLAVMLLLAMPVVSLALPALQVEKPVVAIEAREATPAPTPPAAEAPVIAPVDTSMDAGLPAEPVQAAPVTPPAPKKKLPTGLLLTLGYALGALLLALRLVAGLWTLGRWTQAADAIDGLAWTRALQRAQRRVGVERPVQLLASAHVTSPLSWGLRTPVILVDYDTLDREEDADAVLAHEMAHVARRDWLMLMLSRFAVALFWFNPLVWLLERALVQQCEEAADLRALGDVEPVSYARTLVACGAQAGGLVLPANRIAGQGLARRVRAILDEKMRSTPSGSAWTGIAMLVCVAISVPLAALELVAPAPPAPPEAPRAPVTPLAAVAPRAPLTPVAPPAPLAPPAPVKDAEELAAVIAEAVAEPQFSEAEIDVITADAAAVAARALAADARIDARAARAQATAVRAEATAARAEAVREADLARIEAAATRVALQVAEGATRAAAFATASAAASATARASAKAGPLTADDLIEMKIQGVDVRYLAELAELAPRIRLSAKEIVQTKIHGLTPERLREFADAGYAKTPVDDLVAMRIHGVTGRYIADLAAAGYTGIKTDDLVAMRIHGVSASAAKRAAAVGKRPTPEELVEMQLRGKL